MIALLEAAGYLIVAGAAAEVAVGLAAGLRRSRMERRSLDAAAELFERRAQLLLRRAEVERELTVRSWSGSRKLTVARKIREADGVHSLELTAHDGRPLPPYLPGQYLTFQLKLPGSDRPVVRCYSLSDAPSADGDRYRVTVKKIAAAEAGAPPGLVSGYVNDELAEGDIIDARAPSGVFHCDVWDDRPLVLIAGGIGVTPLLSMLNAICATGDAREVWLFYGVRNRDQHPFAGHLRELAARHPNVRIVTCYSRPTADCVAGRDFDTAGRIDLDLLKARLPSGNYLFYVCGPAPMMTALSDGLRDWGVPASDVRVEAFGAATMRRQSQADATAPTAARRDVEFARAGKTVAWEAASGSILDLADRHGIALESGCRAGHCGTCAIAVKDGSIDYLATPVAAIEPGTCLACLAVPTSRLVLDV